MNWTVYRCLRPFSN